MTPEMNSTNTSSEQKNARNRKWLLRSILFAIIVFGGGYYAYTQGLIKFPCSHEWQDVIEIVHHEAEVVHHDAEYTSIHHEEEIIHHEPEYMSIHHDPEYKTIHHDAQTIHHDAVTEWDWVETKPMWTEQVLVKEAWDEEVPIIETVYKYRCRCGQIFDTHEELEAHWDADDSDEYFAAHMSYSGKYVDVVIGYNTIHHDAEYKSVLHESEGYYEEKVIEEAYDETRPAYNEKVIVKEAWDEDKIINEAYDEVVPAFDEQIIVREAWDEILKEAWDEEVVTGQKCSKCGETK